MKDVTGWDESIRYDYPDLTSNSTVWDVGAYVGEFAEGIHSKYGCRMVLFEMMPSLIEDLRGKFPEFEVMPFGLSGENKTIQVSDDQNCTSTLSRGPVRVEVRRISEVFEGQVDLMKVNIEGDEYSLIQDLYDTKKLPFVKTLQVQFHEVVSVGDARTEVAVPNAEKLYNEAVRQLSKSHVRQWSWPWVWESWTLRELR